MAETTADVRRDIELTRERMSSTLNELEQKLLCGDGIFSRVERGATQCFHMNQRDLAGVQDGKRVVRQAMRVVIL